MKKSTPNRRWIFTLNNPQITGPELLALFESSEHSVKHAVWQLERGKEGTPHFQGYMAFGKPVRMAGIKKLMDNVFATSHLEVARGTPEQCKAYCTKEETREDGPWEYGDMEKTGQGKRTDLLDVKRKLDEGASLLEVAETHFVSWVKHAKAFQEYKRLKATPRDHAMEVIVLFGPTGCGKTRYAKETWPDAYWKPKNTRWFDGYEGQETCILDEMVSGWFMFNELLGLLDRYPFKGEIKNGYVEFVSKRIVITTNFPPKAWYNFNNPKLHFPALLRRLTKFFIFDEYGGYNEIEGPITPAEYDDLFPSFIEIDEQ